MVRIIVLTQSYLNKMKKTFLFIYICVLCTKLISQPVAISGDIFFYFNSHPSKIVSNDNFYALDSVRIHTCNAVFPVWAEWFQQEHFLYDSTVLDYATGVNFKKWHKVPQYSGEETNIQNYEHTGGDYYHNNDDNVVIAFSVIGSCIFVDPKALDTLYSPSNFKKNNSSDTNFDEETVWHDIRSYNNDTYVVFTNIISSKSFTKKQIRKYDLRKSTINKLILYGN